MVSRKRVLPIIIVFSIFTLDVSLARAGSVSAGGWNASWDKSFDDVLGLTALSTGTDSVTFNKFAQFTKGPGDDGAYEPLVITFQQYSPNAKKWIRIGGESVVNQSGLDWTGFKFVLAPPAANGLSFDADKTFASGDSFSISPFTNHALSDNGKELTLSGGIVSHEIGNGNVWNPGQSSGSLWINGAALAGGSRSFELKEIPIDPPAPAVTATAVPLPTGVYPGLMLLAVLGAWKMRARHA
jgi:hypothetical protein